MADKVYDLEDRLLEYAAEIIRISEHLRPSAAGKHIGNQLLRAGTSPYLNHGEAEAAESRKGFVHKLKICLKELRESRRALRLIKRVPLTEDVNAIDAALLESEGLIRIFVASVRTAEKKVVREEGSKYQTDSTSAFGVGRSAFEVESPILDVRSSES